ncbi:hypothetical protein NBRC10512v2_003434 [Rhodotorula toruloides]|uniref:Uncharacterized protein n=1 Tax=Rhodotorula toruloides (strain NP11) TaxID=1130832 RepID=M7WLG2_RHOT1|nr:uncharacterized protein RHTO_05620 [Rhodotorula toruloides NP11]EMS18690.1 hypothetical protein RHTO_05620 [Rhodotorula toruloides NP11]
MTFRVDVVCSPEPEGDGCPEDVISELLELLQPVHSLKHLRFLGFLSFGWDPTDPSLPLSAYHYQTFLDFLSIFPNLRILNLCGYAPLDDKADEITPIQPGGTSTFLKRYPHLDLLLQGMTDSKVVKVFYRTDYVSERELRLRREGPRKEWEGEWWNL